MVPWWHSRFQSAGGSLSLIEPKAIARLPRKRDLTVISDEPCNPHHILLTGEKRSTASPHCRICWKDYNCKATFSKTFAMTLDWRELRGDGGGAEETFINAMTVMQESLTSSVDAASQYAACVALTSPKGWWKYKEGLWKGWVAWKRIKPNKGFSFIKPGRLFMLVNIKGYPGGMTSEEVSQKADRMSGCYYPWFKLFGATGGYIRISFASAQNFGRNDKQIPICFRH